MKRRLFIGSSGEHLNISQQIKNKLDAECSDWLYVEIWNGSGVFEQNKGTLEVLAQATREFDYGIFVAAPDDCLIKRRRRTKVTRDNVLFEAGLFMGGLGLNRTFILASSKVSLPSDFDGSTVIMYNGKMPSDTELDMLVKTLIQTKGHYRMDHMHSTALAYGYYEGFIKPVMKVLRAEGIKELKVFVPKNVSDLNDRIQKHIKDTGAKEKKKNNMVVLCTQDKERGYYWDIPRCLKTLDGLVRYSKYKCEFGKDTNWSIWLKRELDNFCEVLQVLIEEDGIYDENVHITRL